jgi:hypothetical protein
MVLRFVFVMVQLNSLMNSAHISSGSNLRPVKPRQKVAFIPSSVAKRVPTRLNASCAEPSQ